MALAAMKLASTNSRGAVLSRSGAGVSGGIDGLRSGRPRAGPQSGSDRGAARESPGVPRMASEPGGLQQPSLASLLRLRTDTAQPMYQQLEAQIRQMIGDGVLAAG